MSDEFILDDNSRIAVIGGGPSGTFFSIFATKMAEKIGKNLDISIFENKDFNRSGPGGCNHCGGIVSESLVQTLAVEGINLPESVIQKGLNSYKLNTSCGNVQIDSPSREKTIAAVYRGSTPKVDNEPVQRSFDDFLLSLAIEKGAKHETVRIDGIKNGRSRPILFSKGEEIGAFDLVIGAFGVNSASAKMFEQLEFGYRKPTTTKTAIAEISMAPGFIEQHFKNSVFLFLLPDKNIKFAAIIPKVTHVTACIMGKEISAATVTNFMEHRVVKAAIPIEDYQISCRCLPRMNVSAPARPFMDRIVMSGDAGSTRLYKDGIGAAYLMGKGIARTVVYQGVSKNHFMKFYMPLYRNIIKDNFYGKILFAATNVLKGSRLQTKCVLQTVLDEQKSSDGSQLLSSILWDMFTGSERYKKIFLRGINFGLVLRLIGNLFKVMFGRKDKNNERQETR